MTGKEGWKSIPIAGVCWLSSIEYKTGDWKTYKPVRDPETCTRCTLCHIFCPDGAIEWEPDEEDVSFNLEFCKGCGVCANECPVNAIEMVLE